MNNKNNHDDASVRVLPINIVAQHAGFAPLSPEPMPPCLETEDPPYDHDLALRYVQCQIVNEGINADDPLFWMVAQYVPQIDQQGMALNLDAQISLAISKRKTIMMQIAAPNGWHGR